MIFDSTGMKAFPRWSELDRMDRAVSSISDDEGILIAYTDGCSVANKNHKLMPNGDSLNFNQPFYDFYLNCESGYPGGYNIMILPDPENNSNHYIIHDEISIEIDSAAGAIQLPHEKLSYSYIDINEDNGLGDITEKNIRFFKSRTTMSHLTAISHSNKVDWWIVKPAFGGEKYYKILLDENGFSKIDSQYIGPRFITETDIINPTGVGSSKFSTDGNRLAYFSLVDGLHIYDFDRETGALSNHKSLDWAPLNSQNINGDIEFSPSGEFLYICNRESLFQVDLKEEDLSDGLVKIDDFDDDKSGGLFDYMALGPDCKIYVRQIGAFQFDFSSINFPDNKGQDCDFRQGNVIMPYPPNLGNFPHFPRFRVDDDKPCCPAERTPIESAPSLEEVYCGDWYDTVSEFGERICDNPAFFTEMDLYQKGEVELLHFNRFLNGVGRGGFFDLNGYTVGRSETRDGVFTVWPDSINTYQFVRVLGNCDTGFPVCDQPFQCPGLMADVGDPCDDGDPTTLSDTVTNLCECEGESIYDCPTLMLDIGDPCDDGSAGTENDMVDSNCSCVGESAFDCPILMLDIGDNCDDGDATTENDMVTAACLCVGESIYDCEVSMVNFGDPCDDGDPDTENDMINSNCQCEGTYVYDCPTLMVDIGDDCDDDDATTEDDEIDADCNCVGESIFDCPDLMANVGDPCDDGDPNTENDAITPACVCGGDDIYYCQDLLKNVDDPCDDGDPLTVDDSIDIFCDCRGFPVVIPPCPEPIENIACEKWLQDTLASFDPICTGENNVTVYLMEKDSHQLIQIYGIGGGTDVWAGDVYTCDGKWIGYIGYSFGQHYNYSPLGLSEFSETLLGSCSGGNFSFPTCTELDLDGDGFTTSFDCDDQDAEVNPDAVEVCNQMDDNCDGQIDEGLTVVRYYFDGDGDGYGVSDPSIVDCSQQSGYVLTFDDCDDQNASVFPGQTEAPYNGLDDDCDPSTPDDDLDGDGYVLAEDCADMDATISPAAAEICDGLDNNCNSEIDEGLTIIIGYPDTDGDGYGADVLPVEACDLLVGYVENSLDCDDENPEINPDATDIPNNGIDEDCDGADMITDALHELSEGSVIIYPNPTRDLVFIAAEGIDSYLLSLYDYTGRKLLSGVNAGVVDLTLYPVGAFVLVVQDLRSGGIVVERVLRY